MNYVNFMLTSIARITWNLSKDAKENNLNWFIEIGFVEVCQQCDV